ncbi:MAG: fructosamine kinase family protein [Anaerolineales bacterium]|nr:fructosamine kinase family protein [Anaerolineales bacterium]
MPPFSPTLRAAVERAMTARLGRAWRAAQVRDLEDRASHPAAVLTDGVTAVFAKFSAAPDGRAQFEAELSGLRLLAERAGVHTPTPLDLLEAEGGALLLLEALPEVARGPAEWRDLGRALARIHAVTGDTCGLPTANYFGPLPQDNTPLPDWPTFYAERRVRANLRRAVDTGHVPPNLQREVERLIARLPELAGPPAWPCLLHGDAQQNNFVSTPTGTVVIDPAVHYGHPEYDLALLDYFAPVPPDVWAGYREVRPTAPGFAARRDLWRIGPWLAVVAVDGPAWLGQLEAALARFA